MLLHLSSCRSGNPFPHSHVPMQITHYELYEECRTGFNFLLISNSYVKAFCTSWSKLYSSFRLSFHIETYFSDFIFITLLRNKLSRIGLCTEKPTFGLHFHASMKIYNTLWTPHFDAHAFPTRWQAQFLFENLILFIV